MKKLTITTATAITLAMSAVGATAATLDITGIDSSWNDVVPGGVTVNNGDPTSSMRWGTGASQSGYDFTDAPTPILGLAADTQFVVGNFNHLNFPITGTTLDTANLNVDIQIGGGGPLISSVFSFSHDETTNSAPCGPGSVSICDDIVSVSSAAGAEAFSLGGVDYVFQVLGFSTDGGSTIVTDFLTQENSNNPAQLYATFTAVSQVPLPAGMLLMGTALAGFGVMRRRKKAA
ncbi:THxN family PEP-CTERM protein [uncultured Roseobacter sp.]|uniref:THxN family PEP-CTERM protein n=1 Tax=uncultured Roseobacter sp. TaxID=114847 RepID=UPI0026183B7C|nr:THxN family PEP-CTERM protein [uncultured Roseobacter sp.]